MGELKKMKIEAFQSVECQGVADEEHIFIAMFNPETYTSKHEVEYSADEGVGASASSQKFSRIKPREFNFDFVIDGTGIVENQSPLLFAQSEKKDVQAEVDKFLKITNKIDGDIHRPPYLKISWGTLIVKCILKVAEISYTLFKSDGTPIRAKIKATFSENVEDYLRAAEEGKTSPDLTHVRKVNEGDTLPLMAYRIYGDSKYYIHVAKANKMTNFRNLKVGHDIYFPPFV